MELNGKKIAILATHGFEQSELEFPRDRLKQAGARQVRFVCLLAAPEGLQVFAEEHPDVPVFTAAIDRGLDDHGYIRPGLGDAGDRLYGTK